MAWFLLKTPVHNLEPLQNAQIQTFLKFTSKIILFLHIKVILIVFGTIFDIATKPLFISNKLIAHTKKRALASKKTPVNKKNSTFYIFFFHLKSLARYLYYIRQKMGCEARAVYI